VEKACLTSYTHTPFSLTTLDMSFSDFYPSDLSDITSSSEDDAPPAKVKKSSARRQKPVQKLPYTISDALRPPRSTSYSVRSLYGDPSVSFSLYAPHSQACPEQIVDGGINLDPDYQRGTHFSLFVPNEISHPQRCGLGRNKTDWSHRFCYSQLLYPPPHLR
jgi:hypothetical protein